MQVDDTLSYEEHITNTVSACIARLCLINRVNYIFDIQTLLIIINALVFCKLYYNCSSVWSNTCKILRRDFYLVPENMTCTMLSLRDAIFAFECVMGLAPSYLSDKFATRPRVHSVNTRNNHKLSISRYKSAAGQRTFFHRGVTLWNSLLCSVTDNKTLTSFKRNLKNHLVTYF